MRSDVPVASESIKLQFCGKRGLESQLIQRWTLSRFSHVDIVMPDGRLLGAGADGVRLRAPGYTEFRNLTRAEIPATEEQGRIFYDFVASQLGKPYDYKALWAFAFNRDWEDGGAWTSSELAARGLEVAGILPRLFLPNHKVTPVMLAVIVSAIAGAVLRSFRGPNVSLTKTRIEPLHARSDVPVAGESIKLQFCGKRGLESQLIQRWTLSRFSHVDIVMSDGRLLGARADGVRLRPPSYTVFRNRILAEIPATGEQSRIFYDFTASQLGKPYDNKALLAFTFNRDWEDDEAWTCSELPARGLELAGILPRLFVPNAKVTPIMLAVIVSTIAGAVLRHPRDQALPGPDHSAGGRLAA